jgi:hypothetical protein
MSPIIGRTGVGKLSFEDIIFLSLLSLGIITALLTGSAMVFYIVSFMVGLLFGRVWYKTKSALQFKYFLMITLFMVGFIIGNALIGYGSPWITLVLYIAGIMASYYICSKGFFSILDY